MKTMKMKYITTALILLVTATSCEKWMDLKPPQGLIREEFWKSKEDVDAVVMGAYDEFRGMDDLLFKFGEMRGDLVTGDVNLSLNEQKIMEGTIYPDNWMCNWSKFYKVINYCNEVIENAPEVQKIDNTFNDFQLQSYLAEAVFLRSLSYFYLVRVFKDVPFVLQPTESDDVDVYPAKTDGDVILDKISEDLETYRPFITIDGYPTLMENKGRATKAAFDALLADIALWQFDYDDCINHVNKIIASKKYILLTSARWFEMYYPGNSPESIFEFQYNNSLNQNNKLYGLTNRYAYNYDPSEKAIEMFEKDLNRGLGLSIKKYGENDFIIWKYVGRSPDGQTTRSGADQNSANFSVYRYADVLLMKAEALSQLGRFGEALDILNDIRSRSNAGSLVIPDSETAFEDAIMEERAYEFAFEGKRWFDLMRMGRRNNYARKSKLIEILVEKVSSSQKRILATKLTNPLGWYLPIYESEIERNINLVQNPYYNY